MVIRGPVSSALQQLSNGMVFNGKKIIGDYFVQHMQANLEDFLNAEDVAAFFSQELKFDELCSRDPGKLAFVPENASLFPALHVLLRSLSTALFVLFFTASCGRSRSAGLENEQCEASMERDSSDKISVPCLTLSEQSGEQKKEFERPGESAIPEDSTIDETVPHNLPGYGDHTQTDEWTFAPPKDKEDTDDDDDDEEEEEEDEEEEAGHDEGGDEEDYLEGDEEEGDDEGADDNGDADENDGEEGDEDEDEVDEDDDGQEEEDEEDDEDGDQDDEDEGESEEEGEPPSKKRK